MLGYFGFWFDVAIASDIINEYFVKSLVDAPLNGTILSVDNLFKKLSTYNAALDIGVKSPD